MHVDDFIDDYAADHPDEAYARWVLNYFRLSAVLKVSFWPFMQDNQLYCTYDGTRIRMRCTGASRLGDVFLTTDFDQEVGYEKRVDISECRDWSRCAATWCCKYCEASPTRQAIPNRQLWYTYHAQSCPRFDGDHPESVTMPIQKTSKAIK